MIQPLKARKLLFDTSVYIEAIRLGSEADTYHLLSSALPRTYLSAIVVQELYAGALDAIGLRLVDRFIGQTERTERIVSPTYQDWKETGRILGGIARQQPAQRTRIPTLVNDVLLVMTTIQIGATLFTFNAEDFRLIARYKQFSVEILTHATTP